jgi:hypothetical protein
LQGEFRLFVILFNLIYINGMKKIFSLYLVAANIGYGQIKQDTFHDHQLLLPDIKLLTPTFSDNLSNDFLKKRFQAYT